MHLREIEKSKYNFQDLFYFRTGSDDGSLWTERHSNILKTEG